MNVLYLCDRRACEKCSPECHYTSDISHAKNFELGLDGLTMVEKAKPLLVLKTNAVLKQNVVNRIREELAAQVATGVILCDAFTVPVVVDSDNDIYDVNVTKRKDILLDDH